ncbi:peptidoglycan-binding protein, partial [Patescibacteria group bacterium]|nr:peptidoglycan-binding protein [Patescibacteria group bacterium]
MSKLSKRTKKHKIVSIVLSITTTLWLSGAVVLVPVVAYGQTTIADLQVQIQALLSQITQLQSQLATLQGSGVVSAGACTFTRSLFVGVSRGEDVKCLQQYLNGAGFTLASSGGGSVGNETTFFGSRTRNAVSRWQAANSVSPTAGYFGPISQAKYTQVVAVAPPPGVPTVPGVSLGSGLTVAAGVQPAATLAPQSATRIPYTVLNLTASADGNITVKSITVERTGLMNDSAIAGIVLIDTDGTQITQTAKTLNSVHQAILKDAFVIPAGTTKRVTVAANMASSLGSFAGQIGFLSVVAVDAGGAAVLGVLPITGVGHTINSTLSIGSVDITRGALDPNTNSTKEVGTTAYNFAAVKLTAGSAEKIRLHSIRWNQSGSAAVTDLANIEVIVDGVNYATKVSGDFYTAIFDGGILIGKGLTKDITLRGDIVSGSARTVFFDIRKDTDVYVTGETFGYGITVSAVTVGVVDDTNSQFTAVTPFFDASKVDIAAGTLVVSSNNTVPSGSIANGANGVPLASFKFDVTGEPISWTELKFTIATTSGGGTDGDELLTNITVVDQNGTVIAGPQDPTAQGNTVTLSDTVTLPVGINILTVKGNLDNDWEDGDTIDISFNPKSDLTSVKGDVSGDTITPTP